MQATKQQQDSNDSIPSQARHCTVSSRNENIKRLKGCDLLQELVPFALDSPEPRLKDGGGLLGERVVAGDALLGRPDLGAAGAQLLRGLRGRGRQRLCLCQLLAQLLQLLERLRSTKELTSQDDSCEAAKVTGKGEEVLAEYECIAQHLGPCGVFSNA
jgi:hypothetical protein